MFKDQNSKQTQVIILIGQTGAGKSTLFNFLSGAEFEMNGPEPRQSLCIKENSQQFALIKGGMKSVTKSPNYYFSQQFNSLLIDFPGFQDTDGKIDQVLTQLLFYQIMKSANVRIVYVVKHPETQFNNRGTSLQEFISKTFQGENFDMSQICLMLNCYNDKLSDENLITNVQSQLERVYNCRPQNICVIRKIKNKQEIEQYLNSQKRSYLFQQFLRSHPLVISPQYIHESEQIGQYLSEQSEQILEQLCSTLEKNLNDNLKKLTYEQVYNLEESLKQISVFLNNQQKDTVNWFQELINQFEKSIALLNFQNKKCQNYSNFMTIYNFFAQLSEFIPGFEMIRNNCIFAQQRSENTMRIVKGQIDILQKQQQNLYEEQEKMKQYQLRVLADEQQKKEANLKLQAQQSYQQVAILQQATQNDLQSQITSKNLIQNERDNLILKNTTLQQNNQKQVDEKNRQLKRKQEDYSTYQQQLQEFSNDQRIKENEIKQLNENLYKFQSQSASENEKLENKLNEILANHKQLADLVDEERIKKDELMALIKSSGEDQEKLRKRVECLARERNSSCQLI